MKLKKINDQVKIGDIFSDLTVLFKTVNKWNNYDIWECRCICGRITNTSSYHLVKGKYKSCGVIYHTMSMVGEKFGKLTVIKKANKINKQTAWECKCDCGNFFIAETIGLINNRTKSCGCDSRPHLEGKRFGKLLVIKEVEERVGGSVKWECACDCGKKVFPNTSRLLKSGVISCGQCTKNDLVNKKFGRLTVIKFLNKIKGTDKVWLCKCDCGNDVEVKSSLLKSGGVRSCGCLRIIYTDETDVTKKYIFNRYKGSAKRKGRKFELSFENFLILISNKCYYCGAEPNNLSVRGRSSYKYNGIDRVNNELGYIDSNCVSCCSFCNMAKNDLPVEYFLKWVLKLYNNIGKLK
jgi:hypothetical protein